MPTFMNPAEAASALFGAGIPSAPATSTPVQLDRINKGMPYELGGGRYNDNPTIQQSNRDLQTWANNIDALNKVPTVLPPDTLTQDKSVMHVISPNQVQDRVFHSASYMPTSYGAGKYKIYTPAMADQMLKPVMPSIPSGVLNLLKKGLIK